MYCCEKERRVSIKRVSLKLTESVAETVESEQRLCRIYVNLKISRVCRRVPESETAYHIHTAHCKKLCGLNNVGYLTLCVAQSEQSLRNLFTLLDLCVSSW